MRQTLFIFVAATLAACQTVEVPPAPQGLSMPAPLVSASDFEIVLGDNWVGELTYLDYSSGDTVAIPATLSVGPINHRAISYTFGYPDEPQANSDGAWLISGDGQLLDDKTVTSRMEGDNGDLILVMEYSGSDNNAPAEITETLILSASGIVMTKDVQPEGETQAFQRNSFAFSR